MRRIAIINQKGGVHQLQNNIHLRDGRLDATQMKLMISD